LTDSVEVKRKERIRQGETKYGPWTPKNFKASGRTGIGEAIPEILDAISYLEMSYQLAEISIYEFKYYEAILTDICERLKRRVT
jgi:hypothetical protein